MHSLQLPAAPNLSIHSHSHLNPCPLFLLCSSMSRGRALSLAAPEQTKGLKDAVQRNKAIKMAGAWAFCAARAAASVCMLTALRRRPCLACLPASRHRPPLQRCYPGPPVHSLAPRRPVAPAADKAQWKLGRAAKKGEADRCGAGQGCLSFRIRTVHAAWLIDSLFGGSPPHCPPKLTLACSAAINLAVISAPLPPLQAHPRPQAQAPVLWKAAARHHRPAVAAAPVQLLCLLPGSLHVCCSAAEPAGGTSLAAQAA